MADKIQLRRDTKARWEQYNPVLASGEPGYELDSLLYKLGDGKTAWNDLPYRGAGGGGGSNIVDSEDITKDDTGISTSLYIADRPVNSAKYVDKVRASSIYNKNNYRVTLIFRRWIRWRFDDA